MIGTLSGSTSTGNPYIIAIGVAAMITVGVYLYYNPPTHTELTLPRYRIPINYTDLPQAISITVPTTATKPFDIPKDLTNIFLHYTNVEGILSIGATSTIRADYKQRVFITPMLFTPAEVFELLFLGREGYESKGDYVVMFRLRPDQMANVRPDPENIMELIHIGNIKLALGQILYIGPNPLK